MPEEIENLNDDNNVNRQEKSSSKSPPKKIIDFNEYKKRRNSSAGIPNKNPLNKTIFPNIGGNNPLNRMKNNVSNQVLNKVSNANRALKAVSTLNNINNARKERKANNDKVTDTISNGINSTNNDSTGEEKTVNSILDFNKKFKSNFSLMGRLSFKTKMILFSIITLFGLLFLILIPLFIISMFSSFFGLEDRGNSMGNINYGDYVLSSDGHSILHETLDSFLENKGSSLDNFNNLIKSNVAKAGYGTRAGVVAAAVTLIAELGNNYQVKLPYFWGGGHGQMVEGASSNWGSSECHTNANGRSYNYCGLDCSGFATWAIYNGGFKIQAMVTNNFQHLPGAERVTLTDSAVLQPGDLLESTYHVAVVVKVEDDGYLCAEAAGDISGILFTKMAFNNSNYWGVKLDGFYDTQVRS